MNTSSIFQAIENWRTLIDSYKKGKDESRKKLLELLNQGSHFSVKADEIQEWTERLANASNPLIHVYAGIDKDVFKFYLIDSESDAKGDFSYIVTKEMNRNPPYNLPNPQLVCDPISSQSAIYRNFIFNMFCSAWMETQKEDFFRIITVPFEDYTRMNLNKDECCISFFGLTNEKVTDASLKEYHIELITMKDLDIGSISSTAENCSTPRPPFTAADPDTNYQLLLKSDASV
ncbi:hypothetical protein QE422_002190 [Chryseobacterium sp. SORGH_AS 447]|uniref:hypothetical protein n=1 Tax=Chryseobacterium sp. SORGH_AS_0447 TaxID=3041769 RepID=UPI002782C7E2|nr:hypothetical protein [Chryseobacterium sp. SORGH_AS_0447]MDQ1161822.1 hypothetical protein [Chryseobacterium sp. SORGH_AS_0447]